MAVGQNSTRAVTTPEAASIRAIRSLPNAAKYNELPSGIKAMAVGCASAFVRFASVTFDGSKLGFKSKLVTAALPIVMRAIRLVVKPPRTLGSKRVRLRAWVLATNRSPLLG